MEATPPFPDAGPARVGRGWEGPVPEEPVPEEPVPEGPERAGPAPPPDPAATLRTALLDSRNRWRDAALLVADLVLETDAEARIAFLAPERVLGHVADGLIGEPAARLLDLPDPAVLRPGLALRDLRIWARDAAGAGACLLASVAVLQDTAGHAIGLRIVARDVTAEEAAAGAAAQSLRRMEARDQVAARCFGLADPCRRIAALLEGLREALGLEAAAVLDLGEGPGLALASHVCGSLPDALLPLATAMAPGTSRFGPWREGPFAMLALDLPEDRRPVLAALRRVGERDWDADDRYMLGAVRDLLRPQLSAEWYGRRLEREAGTDALTGLLNRRAFVEGLERRLQRVAHGPRAAGALLFLDLDNFKPVNDERGHAAGDAALRRVAALVRDGVRPSDLVGRLGGDEFAAWLDGVDAEVAGMRAEVLLRLAAIELRDIGLPGRALLMSIGVAAIVPDEPEDAAAMLARADAAMYAAKRGGGARWALAAPPPPSGGNRPAPDQRQEFQRQDFPRPDSPRPDPPRHRATLADPEQRP